LNGGCNLRDLGRHDASGYYVRTGHLDRSGVLTYVIPAITPV
jgi:hypothetical protein